MANSSVDIVSAEEDIDEPVPASELQELNEEKRILSSVYRHVEHQQAVEQVAGVAGVVADERDLSLIASESKSPSSPWITAHAHRTPSLPISAIESEGSVSGGLQARLSGPGSTDAGDIISRADTAEELLSLSPSLDSALKLNMNLQKRFRERIQKLEYVFMKNMERQALLKEEITNAKMLREQDQRSDGTGKIPLRISHFCVPYFKNRSGMPASMNDDAKMKVKTGYIDLYVTRTRTWLTVEKQILEETVRKEWKEQSIKASELTIRELERKLKYIQPEDSENLGEQLKLKIEECKHNIKVLEKTPLDSVAPDREEQRLDWDRIAALAFDGHRTSDECRLQWENLLHPAVNASPWTESEDLYIQKLILNSRTKLPDWEKIASELNTNRTPYLVMQRYVSFIEPTLKPRRWSKKDTDKLLQTISMLRVGTHIPWAQVHQHLVGFSRPQIQSRWRMIDPEVSKGPFTVEEDFILIKGLHMFGLNFGNIAHFMPGRSFPQVRERFKRTILPGLSVKPWTKEEDAILISECSVGPRNWRKMIMELPRFDACQIRCRYHIIQVWQTISGTNMVPPPLFPVTATVNPEAIQEIRTAMIMESNELKQLVDKSRKGITMKSVVRELEERRLLIKERKTGKNLQKIKKVTEKRGRQPGTPNPHYTRLQDIFLTEFFIPYRNYPSYPCLSFESIQYSLMLMSKALQVKIVKHITESEAEQLSYLQLTSNDLEMVKHLTITHTTKLGLCCGSGCSACEPAHPERIPLLPPCKAVVGAFRSLLLHRPKLSEMATREFCLYRYSKEELLTLNANMKGRRPGRRKETSLTLQNEHITLDAAAGPSQAQSINIAAAGPIQIKPGNVAEGGISQEEVDAGMRSELESHDLNGSIAKQCSTPSKIHITSSLSGRADGKKKQMKAKKLPPMDINQGGIKAYTRGKSLKPEPIDVFKYMPNIKLEVNGQEMQSSEDLQPKLSSYGEGGKHSDEEARQTSDNLLFQRMLSLFYWPAMMTLIHPPQNLINQINAKIESGDVPQPQGTISDRARVKKLLTKDELNIVEQANYIQHLHELEVHHQETKKSVKQSSAVKQKELVDNDDDHKISSDENEVNFENLNETGNLSYEDLDNGEVTIKKRDGRHCNKQLASFQRKRNLKSLRRSLVMKTIWDLRRKGCYKQRTSDRNKRSYNPRASRTRNRVRKDMIRPPKSPKPWDLPLDGPMKVQPQVPFVPSEVMLSHAFSETTSNMLNVKAETFDISATAKSKESLNVMQDVKTHVAKKTQSKVLRRKGGKLSSQDHLEAPIKIQGHNTHVYSMVDDTIEKETQNQPETFADIKHEIPNISARKGKPKTLRKGTSKTQAVISSPKSVNEEARRFLSTTVEVHAQMTDVPKSYIQLKGTQARETSSSKMVEPSSKGQVKLSSSSVRFQSKSQKSPLVESVDDTIQPIRTRNSNVDTMGVPSSKDFYNQQMPLRKGPRLLRKRSFETSFRNLVEDTVEETQENAENKRALFDPDIATSEEAFVQKISTKKLLQAAPERPLQVNFQSLIDDSLDMKEDNGYNNSSTLALGLEPPADIPVKIQPLAQNPPRRSQRKSLGGQLQLPLGASYDEFQSSSSSTVDLRSSTHLSLRKQSNEAMSFMMASDKQLRIQPQVLLQPLPLNIVQPLLEDQTAKETFQKKTAKSQASIKSSSQNSKEMQS